MTKKTLNHYNETKKHLVYYFEKASHNLDLEAVEKNNNYPLP